MNLADDYFPFTIRNKRVGRLMHSFALSNAFIALEIDCVLSGALRALSCRTGNLSDPVNPAPGHPPDQTFFDIRAERTLSRTTLPRASDPISSFSDSESLHAESAIEVCSGPGK